MNEKLSLIDIAGLCYLDIRNLPLLTDYIKEKVELFAIDHYYSYYSLKERLKKKTKP